MTIYNSTEDIQLEANSIWRDVGMYIVATLTVIVFGIIGSLTTISAIILLCEYFLLVFIVWYQDRNAGANENEELDIEL